jgi:hypothetical protein
MRACVQVFTLLTGPILYGREARFANRSRRGWINTLVPVIVYSLPAAREEEAGADAELKEEP